MQAILQVNNVGKVYVNGVHALQNISFEVHEGEFISIIGPSGSGKSTLLRSINRLQNITSGNIYIDGGDIAKESGKELRKLRRKVAMIFQNYNLVYRLSVLQNVLHGRLGYMSTLDGILYRYAEEDKMRAIQLLEEIDMGAFINNRAADLSGGQKQRVGIARAFIQDPKILLCDEPIASLDPSSAKIIMDMIYKMAKKRNIACVVNLHQIDVARKYSTRIIGLCKGEILFDGKPEELSHQIIEQIYDTPINQLMIKNEEVG